MKPIQLICSNIGEPTPELYPFKTGVPIPQGELKSIEVLFLEDEQGQRHPIQTNVLSNWPDGSIKWIYCETSMKLPADSRIILYLKDGFSTSSANASISITKSPKNWLIDTGEAQFSIDTHNFHPFNSVKIFTNGQYQQVSVDGKCILIDEQDQQQTASIEKLTIESKGLLRTTLLFQGRFPTIKDKELLFEARIHFFTGTARIQMEFRLHNPSAAKHPGGLWDLGDPASILFSGLNFSIPVKNDTSHKWQLRLESNGPWLDSDGHNFLKVYQEASGGEHWDSPVHLSLKGKVPMDTRGYRANIGEKKIQGNRAQPIIQYNSEGTSISASITDFWQRFPNMIEVNKNEFSLSLFPSEFPELHELQAGEMVSQEIWLDFNASPDTPAWENCNGTYLMPAAEGVHAAGVLFDSTLAQQDTFYQEYLDASMDKQYGFKARRERIDEYGWRNFGELYADHEAVYHQGKSLFISHYNNQYDPTYSFYRQALVSGNPRWLDIAAPLAKHVADIDIYHTEHDREEYNHGLFWHTEHYLDAGTATHRSQSKEHFSQKDPQLCGGGPGAEHCYSSGLMLHYFLTGDPRYKDLVLQLADWVYLSISGSQTLSGTLLRGMKAFKRWASQRGTAQLWPQYPLTRGTGNCLNTTLDALDLSGNQSYLERAGQLVCGTVHPEDDIGERDLLNVEDIVLLRPERRATWSYTIFLVAVTRYLLKKQEWQQWDSDYAHARDSLLAYVRWMVANESPYMNKKEILEFPNETWAAQEIRKSVIIYQAATYVKGAERQIFLQKSRYFLNAGFSELSNWDSRYYTRPMVLVLQNGWIADKLNTPPPPFKEMTDEQLSKRQKTPHLTLIEVFKRTILELLKTLPETSFQREWKWVKFRLRKV